MKILKNVQRFPAGLMIIPLLLAVLINTYIPQVLQIGGFTSGLLSKAGISTFVGLFLFVSGAGINVKQIGIPLYKGAVLTVSKVGIAIAIGVTVGMIFGRDGILGLTPLAIIAALGNCNSVMYAILAGQVGDATDVGAVSVLGLDDGPFFTMIALGAAGMATIPFMDLVSVIVPLLLGMILGNLDEDIRDLCEKGSPLVYPFAGFVLGASMNLKDVIKAGIPGVILGLVSVFVTGFFCYWVFNLFFGRKRKSVVGFGVGNTAGNAVVTPNAIGMSDPVWAPYAAVATAQVAAACIVTAILCPLVYVWLHSRLQKKYAQEDAQTIPV